LIEAMSKDPLKISGMHNGAHPKVFSNASKLRDRMTEGEKKLWEYLRLKPQGFKFRRQHPLGNYILDFYCHKLRISLELDGDYHLSQNQKEKDSNRTDYLRELGIREYRFTNREVFEKFDELVQKLQNILSEATPSGAGGERGSEKS